MVARALLFAAGLLLLAGCTRDNPMAPQGKTGNLAPRVLYKTSSTQASVQLPPAVLPFAQTMQVVIRRGTGTLRDTAIPFSVGRALIGQIAEGQVDVTTNILDNLGTVIYSGTGNGINIVANDTAAPTIVDSAVLQPAPQVMVSVAGNAKVKLVVTPASRFFNDIWMTVFKQNGASLWDSVLTRYYEVINYSYDSALNQATFNDSGTHLFPGSTYKYRVHTRFWDSTVGTWGEYIARSGYSSQPSLTLTANSVTFNGRIFGNATNLTHILLYPDSGGGSQPSSPPSSGLAYAWDMDTLTSSTYFSFPNIAPGLYFAYAYDGYWRSPDNWATALKTSYFQVDLRTGVSDTNLNMNFAPAVDTVGGYYVWGNITGFTVGAKPIAELWWVSASAPAETLYLGDTYAYDYNYLGQYSFYSVPRLIAMAAYRGYPTDPGDKYLLRFWADANNNGVLDVGERYHETGTSSGYFYELGDVLGNIRVPDVDLNTIW